MAHALCIPYALQGTCMVVYCQVKYLRYCTVLGEVLSAKSIQKGRRVAETQPDRPSRYPEEVKILRVVRTASTSRHGLGLAWRYGMLLSSCLPFPRRYHSWLTLTTWANRPDAILHGVQYHFLPARLACLPACLSSWRHEKRICPVSRHMGPASRPHHNVVISSAVVYSRATATDNATATSKPGLQEPNRRRYREPRARNKT